MKSLLQQNIVQLDIASEITLHAHELGHYLGLHHVFAETDNGTCEKIRIIAKYQMSI